jgi:hypothetical protein
MGAHYRAASAAIATQAEAAESARSAMPEPVPYDPAQMIRDARESGNILQMASLPFQMFAQRQRRDAAHEEAARIVAERDQAFGHAAGEIPPFEPPPLLGDGGSARAGGPARADVPPARRADAPSTSDSPAPDPGATPGSTNPASAAPGAAPPHTPGHGIPTPTGPPAHDVGGPSDPPRGTASPAPPGSTDPAGAVSPASAAPGPPGPGATTPSAAGLAQGFGPPGGFGPTGFGPGVLPGPVAVPPRLPAAGPGQGEGEESHKRPEYLVESELEGMFGSDEMTSPPVIGEVSTWER